MLCLPTLVWSKGTSGVKACCVFKAAKIPKAPKVKTIKVPVIKIPKVAKPKTLKIPAVHVPKVPMIKPVKVSVAKPVKLPKPPKPIKGVIISEPVTSYSLTSGFNATIPEQPITQPNKKD